MLFKSIRVRFRTWRLLRLFTAQKMDDNGIVTLVVNANGSTMYIMDKVSSSIRDDVLRRFNDTVEKRQMNAVVDDIFRKKTFEKLDSLNMK